jgi:hypothetical protein
MKGSSEIGERSTASESTQAWESYGNRFAISKLEDLMGGATRADAAAQTTSATNETTMTAASLLWGRGPMTTAPMRSSTSASTSMGSFSASTSASSSLSSTTHDRKTNPNSPASNAAAALLVGMSMRKERENQPPPAIVAATDADTTTATNADTATEAFDVETRWRAIRQKISKQTEAATEQPSCPEQESLELPKGVTRRPSGAWQAQIYFAGKTRYIGVWEKPYQAAIAYNLAKEALKELKTQQKNSSSYRKRQRYILAKEALKEHKDQHKNSIDLLIQHRKRQRHHPTDTQEGCSKAHSREFTMATPQRESKSLLPPSITWPSSASSSSTVSSGGFRSPPYTRGPFKKRMGTDHSLMAAGSDGSFEEPRAPSETFQPLSQQQQHQQQLPQDLEAVASNLPRGHPYSAFSQQPLSQQHSNTPANLTHPALQLLSLRPPLPHPQLTSHWMHAHPSPPPPSYHHQQHYHHRGFHRFPYSQPMPPPREDYNGMQSTKMQGNTNHQNAPPMAKDGGKKTAKNGMNRKKSKPAKKVGNGPPTAKDTERDAQNEKWKSIRAEVLAIFTEAKNRKLEGKSNGNGENDDSKAKRTFDKDVLRGITVRPSGKYQAQLYFGGRSRYIGVFNSEYDAASAYEMIRSRLKNEPRKEGSTLQSSSSSSSSTSSSSSSMSLSSLPMDTSIQNCKEGEDANATDTTASTATMMRSITPSPTPSPKIRGALLRKVTEN